MIEYKRIPAIPAYCVVGWIQTVRVLNFKSCLKQKSTSKVKIIDNRLHLKDSKGRIL